MPPKVVEKRSHLPGTPPPGTPPPEGDVATTVGTASGPGDGNTRAITTTVLPTLPKDPFVEALLAQGGLPSCPAPMSLENPQVMKEPYLWYPLIGYLGISVRDLTTSWGGRGELMLAFRQRMKEHLPKSTEGDLDFLESAFRTCVVLYENISDSELLIQSSTDSLKCTRLRIWEAEARLFGGAAGVAYLEGRTLLNPNNYGPGAETAVKRAGFHMRPTGGDHGRERPRNEKRQRDRTCKNCGVTVTTNFFAHNKVCAKKKEVK